MKKSTSWEARLVEGQSVQSILKAEAQAKEFELKIPGNSLSQVFEILRGVTMQRWGSTDSWRINMLTRKQRECFALFGMTPIKGTRKD